MRRHRGEHAVIRACPSCRRHVLEAAPGGLPVLADPENLAAPGELAALLQGRLTFDVLILGLPKRMLLEYRDTIRIRAGRRYPVVAQHQCGKDLILYAEPYDDSIREIFTSARQQLPDIPPF